jgi:hypothetical protein
MFVPLDKSAVQRITLKLGAAGVAWGLLVAISAGSSSCGHSTRR